MVTRRGVTEREAIGQSSPLWPNSPHLKQRTLPLPGRPRVLSPPHALRRAERGELLRDEDLEDACVPPKSSGGSDGIAVAMTPPV